MKLDHWNRVIDPARSENDNRVSYQAPRDALQLFCFSRYVLEWLPKGDWRILQIDNSTVFDSNSASIFSGLLFGAGEARSSVESRAFLFEFGNDRRTNRSVELLIANLVFVLLLLEGHASLVSSNSDDGQLLSLQDGFVYFLSRNGNESRAEALLQEFEHAPLTFPEWVREILVEDRAE